MLYLLKSISTIEGYYWYKPGFTGNLKNREEALQGAGKGTVILDTREGSKSDVSLISALFHLRTEFDHDNYGGTGWYGSSMPEEKVTEIFREPWEKVAQELWGKRGTLYLDLNTRSMLEIWSRLKEGWPEICVTGDEDLCDNDLQRKLDTEKERSRNRSRRFVRNEVKMLGLAPDSEAYQRIDYELAKDDPDFDWIRELLDTVGRLESIHTRPVEPLTRVPGYGSIQVSPETIRELPETFRLSQIPVLEPGCTYSITDLERLDEYLSTWKQKGVLDRHPGLIPAVVVRGKTLESGYMKVPG